MMPHTKIGPLTILSHSLSLTLEILAIEASQTSNSKHSICSIFMEKFYIIGYHGDPSYPMSSLAQFRVGIVANIQLFTFFVHLISCSLKENLQGSLNELLIYRGSSRNW
ncbi:unnamed protein product [Ilex paraguariensis]|uniref:Uncharacterized protein n=1 Tax=Ilex paraguariensis TaxID=185542 RepID=A0ABC8UT17_9AQUA